MKKPLIEKLWFQISLIIACVLLAILVIILTSCSRGEDVYILEDTHMGDREVCLISVPQEFQEGSELITAFLRYKLNPQDRHSGLNIYRPFADTYFSHTHEGYVYFGFFGECDELYEIVSIEIEYRDVPNNRRVWRWDNGR